MESIQRRTPAQQFLGDLFMAGYSARQIKKGAGLTNQQLDQIRRGSDNYFLFCKVFIAWCEAWPYVNDLHTRVLRETYHAKH